MREHRLASVVAHAPASGFAIAAMTGSSEIYDLGQRGTKRCCSTIADALLDLTFEPVYFARCDWPEPASSGREVDACGAGIFGIGAALHEAGAFDDSNHCRHRLFGEVRPSGKLPHPQAVLFEQRDEN